MVKLEVRLGQSVPEASAKPKRPIGGHRMAVLQTLRPFTQLPPVAALLHHSIFTYKRLLYLTEWG